VSDSQISHHWQPLADYDSPPESLARPELVNLAEIWQEQRTLLENSDGLKSFNDRLRREWAIETGLLERIYSLDRGVTQILIERGIDAALLSDGLSGQDPTRVAAIIRDHEAVIEGLFAFVRGERTLSPGYIKELHSQLTRNQPTTTALDPTGKLLEVPLLHGKYKVHQNNPTRPDGSVHQYCPPEQVASEMDRLVELHLTHGSVSPEVEAAWLHHRFTQIHPFQDGNGRVARCLATIVLIRAGWFPLVIRDTQAERARYLDSLELADGGDLSAIVGAFAAAEKRAFVQALGISGQVLRLTRPEQVILAAKDLLVERERKRQLEWERAKETAHALKGLAASRLIQIAERLTKETRNYLPGSNFRADSEMADGKRSGWFRWQVIETAKQLAYFANTEAHREWTRLVLRSGSQSEILVSFHGIGHEFRGILAVSACFFRREQTGSGDREVVEVTPLSSEIFQINYLESLDAAQARFTDWFEEVLVRGLELWRKGL